MNATDIIILICLIPAVIQGLIKGFTTQVAGILGIIVGVWASFRFSELVGGWLQPYLDVSPQVLHVVAFSVILIAVILGLALLGKAMKGILKIAMLGWLDKLLGVLFGLIKAGLIVSLLVLLFDTLNTRFAFVKEEVLGESVLYPVVKELGYTVFPYLKELLFKQ